MTPLPPSAAADKCQLRAAAGALTSDRSSSGVRTSVHRHLGRSLRGRRRPAAGDGIHAGVLHCLCGGVSEAAVAAGREARERGDREVADHRPCVSRQQRRAQSSVSVLGLDLS